MSEDSSGINHPTTNPTNMSNEQAEFDEESTAEYHVRKFIEELGLDMEDEHIQDTPRRIVEAYRDDLFKGIDKDPTEHLETTFEDYGSNTATDAGWVIVDNIEVKSVCAHHFLPIEGVAHVGYIPRDKVVGLSKLSRVVEGYARRPQVQERMTNQIADAVHNNLQPVCTVVAIKATHGCMSCRGVREPHSATRTSAIRGKAKGGSNLEQKFYQLLDMRTE